MDNEYFRKNENGGFKKLKEFNDNVHLFPEVYKTPDKYDYDASATTSNRTFNIEIKVRNQTLTEDNKVVGVNGNGKPYTGDTIIIESHKMASQLLHANFYGFTPLYVNFLEDNTILIFNLHSLKHFPDKKNDVKTYSKGYERNEKERKYYLSIDDACIYKNNTLVKAACNDKSTTNC